MAASLGVAWLLLEKKFGIETSYKINIIIIKYGLYNRSLWTITLKGQHIYMYIAT